MTSLYVKHSIWDFVLVAIVSVSMCYQLLTGFYVDPALQYGPVPAVAAIACLLALFAVSSSKRTMLPGGVAYGIALFVVWAASAALTPDGAVFVDNETNYLIFAMVVTLTATTCFLLSRSRVGSAVLFMAGTLLAGLVQLFYGRYEIIWVVLFVLAALALVMYKNYLQSVRTAKGVEDVSFVPGFAASAIAAVAAVGLGLCVWFCIIAPLSPEAAEIKLVTEYRALETVQVRGTSDVYQTPNLDITSDVTNDESRTTDDIKEDVNGTPWPATGETESEPENQQSDGSSMGLNPDNVLQAFDLQSNPQNWPLAVALLLLVAAVLLYFVSRRAWRERRLAHFKALGTDEGFKQTFLFLMERFRRVGIAVPPGQTMREFGVSSAAAVRCYDEEAGVAFKDVAEGYSRLVYGGASVDAKDVSNVEAFYRGFWKAARKQLGSVKYFFKSFRL